MGERVCRFDLRCTMEGRAMIQRLAKRWQCDQTEAVMMAVTNALMEINRVRREERALGLALKKVDEAVAETFVGGGKGGGA